MRALIALLRRQKDKELLMKFAEYDTVYKRHKKIISKAREYRGDNKAIPIELIARGIEGKLDLVRRTLQLIDAVFTHPAVVKCDSWNVRHMVKKYNLGLWDENTQVRICATLSAAMAKR